VIELPNPIYQLKSPNCQNCWIFVVWVGDWITQPNLPTEISKLSKLLDQCHLVWVGDSIIPPDLPIEISELPKLPDQCYPVWVGDPIIQPNLPTELYKSPKLPEHHCPTWFTTIPPDIYLHIPFQNLVPYPLVPMFSGGNIIDFLMYQYSIWNLHQPINDHIYILVGDIILSPTLPFHIQHNFWNFHVSNTKFCAWYLL
jgi:hypothetical protein